MLAHKERLAARRGFRVMVEIFLAGSRVSEATAGGLILFWRRVS
jgi:hypothetical protein